eukprot:COSAG06_NODE_899_length_11665_cov_50.453052_5_plen_113_part_00
MATATATAREEAAAAAVLAGNHTHQLLGGGGRSAQPRIDVVAWAKGARKAAAIRRARGGMAAAVAAAAAAAAVTRAGEDRHPSRSSRLPVMVRSKSSRSKSGGSRRVAAPEG